eukprot:09761.XXX_509924_510043_1 [CDS] Oithona nana genome sequencing.
MAIRERWPWKLCTGTNDRYDIRRSDKHQLELIICVCDFR